MDINNLSFGQRIDPENGYVECWFTHGALDEIKSMDLSDKNILMFGSGLGDCWLAKRCKMLYVIERTEEWFNKGTEFAKSNGVLNLKYILRPCADSTGMDKYYLEIPKGFEPDVIINDDAYRTECCQMAVDYFKNNNKAGVLISDNWHQSFVWISPKAEEIMEPYAAHIHEQADHLDNDGINKWKTAIHFIK